MPIVWPILSAGWWFAAFAFYLLGSWAWLVWLGSTGTPRHLSLRIGSVSEPSFPSNEGEVARPAGATVEVLNKPSEPLTPWPPLPQSGRGGKSHKSRLATGLVCLAGAAIGLSLDAQASVRVGAIPLSLGSAAYIALSICLVIAMAYISSRSALWRTRSLTVAAHLALLLGSFAFLMPLGWMVLTSLRDGDDIGRSGAVDFNPQIPVTRAYMDPQFPAFEFKLEGTTVQADQVDEQPGGKVSVEVREPKSVAGTVVTLDKADAKVVPREVPVVKLSSGETALQAQEMPDGRKRVIVDGVSRLVEPALVKPVTKTGFKWSNYAEVSSYLPKETHYGWLYLQNTLLLAGLNILGTLLASSLVAYGFARFDFPAKNAWFLLLLSTMMLPGAVTMLPSFLIFRNLGWIDTLYPLWVPAFFGSAFNIFLLRQFFSLLPRELDQAATLDGCSPLRVYWSILLPQVKPVLITIAIGTFMGQWGSFQGPLIYTNSVEKMPIAYGLQLFIGDRSTEPALLMAASVMVLLPLAAIFFATQKYFMEQISLAGIGEA